MKPAAFLYARPRSLSEAVDLLARQASRATLLAGGQSLVPLLSRRLVRPSQVIDINRIPGLDAIEPLPTEIRMGALVRQEQALSSALVRAEAPGVAAALAWVANPVVRARGTVIGNLMMNSPGAELPAVALALDARFVVRYIDREETMPAELVLGPAGRVPAEAIVTHVLWPRQAARVGFYEVARREGHAPVVSSLVSLSGSECRVSLSGVCVSGLSCPTMAGVIARQFPNVPPAGDLARALRDDLAGAAYADGYSSAQYRLDVAPVVSQRATRMMVLRDLAA